jgi:hypothetical protein
MRGENDGVVSGGEAEDALDSAACGLGSLEQLGGARRFEAIGPLRRMVHFDQERQPR